MKRHFAGKYWFYVSVIFFLIMAFIYLRSTPIYSKISSKISLNNNSGISLDSVLREIKSRSLVQQTIEQLSFEVKYFNKKKSNEEIYGDSLPIKLILNKLNPVIYDKTLTINPLSSHSFSIENVDTTQFYELNEQIDQYFGKFRVTRGPAFKSHFKPLLVKFSDPSFLVAAYYKNLDAKLDKKARIITVSVLVNNAQKGKDFLNKLIDLYNSKHKTPAHGGQLPNADSLQHLKLEISAFKVAAKNTKSLTVPTKNTSLSRQQLKTLEVIKPYLQKPVNQFVQVPYIDELQNTDLRNNLERFNKAEIDKQHLLAENKIDDLAVRGIDKKLNIFQSGILKQIELLHDGKPTDTKTSQLLADRQLYDAQLKYQNLSKTFQLSQTKSSTQIVRWIEKPGINSNVKVVRNWFLIYVLALFLGFSVPAIFIFFNTINTSIKKINWFNSQTLIEKIKILLGSKQID
jgi:hypothetical protein